MLSKQGCFHQLSKVAYASLSETAVLRTCSDISISGLDKLMTIQVKRPHQASRKPTPEPSHALPYIPKNPIPP
ncbi:hypothetical protein BDV96DRAFT_569605 [Lophiotrema nucula]|uniref:Uncharacterized protein n=1 Tax=Lophiotrema nucula TaxID=690887 RepID=A0A6A5ZIN9_9PLEO|nr:hypothetical protein BDV96DRAFT_569605 [Lophiotrema nucula]